MLTYVGGTEGANVLVIEQLGLNLVLDLVALQLLHSVGHKLKMRRKFHFAKVSMCRTFMHALASCVKGITVITV